MVMVTVIVRVRDAYGTKRLGTKRLGYENVWKPERRTAPRFNQLADPSASDVLLRACLGFSYLQPSGWFQSQCDRGIWVTWASGKGHTTICCLVNPSAVFTAAAAITGVSKVISPSLKDMFYRVNITPATFVISSAVHANFCTKFYATNGKVEAILIETA